MTFSTVRELVTFGEFSSSSTACCPLVCASGVNELRHLRGGPMRGGNCRAILMFRHVQTKLIGPILHCRLSNRHARNRLDSRGCSVCTLKAEC